MKRYTWTNPKIQGGQRARFYDHRGNEKVGECLRVVTHYNDRTGVAYHVYEMRADGHERRLHVGGSQIIGPVVATA